MTNQAADNLSQERRDLLEALTFQRAMFLGTAEGLTEEEARRASTVSELSIGGLIKHVTLVEDQWVQFVTDGPAAFERHQSQQEQYAAWAAAFHLTDDETLAGAIAAYQEVAARTDALMATIDLDATQPLPVAPWFPPGAVRSARRTFNHVLAELAQHSGHADIIREAIDGRKSMG